MFSDVKIMYSEEFELGIKALEIIDEICYIRLPKDEAVYIALYFVNMQENHNSAYDTLKFIKGILKANLSQSFGCKGMVKKQSFKSITIL